MAEDPTRIMRSGGEPPGRRPPQQRPHGNVRLVIALMGAVIVGLFIALLVVSGSGGTKTVTVTAEPEVTQEEPGAGGEEGGRIEPQEGGGEEGAEGEEAEPETGGIEETEPEAETEEESGGIEEVLPEEEGGIGIEEEGGGGVEAE